MNNFKKKCSKIQDVDFDNCNLGPQLTNFEKWFPKMISLEFCGVNIMTDSKCIEKYIPSLEYLKIDLKAGKENENHIGNLNVAKMLRLINVFTVSESEAGIQNFYEM